MNQEIDNFLKTNLEQLKKIYDEGIKENEDGILLVNYLKQQDKVDVMFLNTNKVNEIITEEGWKEMKEKAKGHRICLVNNDGNIVVVHLN